MKYVVSWISKAGLGEADAARSLAVFAKWSPLPTTAFSEFLGRVDGRGGFAVVETEDPSAVLRDASIFMPCYGALVRRYPIRRRDSRYRGEAADPLRRSRTR